MRTFNYYLEAVHKVQADKFKKYITIAFDLQEETRDSVLQEIKSIPNSEILKIYKSADADNGTIIFFKCPSNLAPEDYLFGDCDDIYTMDWKQFCSDWELPESFIRDFKDFVDWSSVSKYSKMSEKFILKFKDKVDWHNILRYQDVSLSFKYKYNHLDTD